MTLLNIILWDFDRSCQLELRYRPSSSSDLSWITSQLLPFPSPLSSIEETITNLQISYWTSQTVFVSLVAIFNHSQTPKRWYSCDSATHSFLFESGLTDPANGTTGKEADRSACLDWTVRRLSLSCSKQGRLAQSESFVVLATTQRAKHTRSASWCNRNVNMSSMAKHNRVWRVWLSHGAVKHLSLIFTAPRSSYPLTSSLNPSLTHISWNWTEIHPLHGLLFPLADCCPILKGSD